MGGGEYFPPSLVEVSRICMMRGASGYECGNLLGKNTIDPSGRRVEKPRKATYTLTFNRASIVSKHFLFVQLDAHRYKITGILNRELPQCSMCYSMHCSPSSNSFNHLQTNRRPLYLNPQSVPRCKHFSSRL
jgi:hypothetical protein